MTSGKKVVISTFISVLIFAAFAFFAFTQLFSLFETKFYQGNVISSMKNQLDVVSKSFDEYASGYETLFSNFASLDSVKKSSEQSLDSYQIKERADFAGKLISENPGFEGIRIIDSQGKKVHYSTYETDKLRQNKDLINYKNYNILGEVDYTKIASPPDEKIHTYFDSQRNRIIFSLPYIDERDLNRGSIVFYVGADNFLNYLFQRKIISYSEKCSLFNLETEKGQGINAVVFGIPSLSGKGFLDEVEKTLKTQDAEVEELMSGEDFNWMMISSTGENGQMFATVFKSDILTLNLAMKVLLLSCVFVTLYLLILLFFNIKQDDELIIRSRIKNFQVSLINEYLDAKSDDKDDVDWNQISKNIAVRKDELNREIKKSLGRRAKKREAYVDALLEKSWTQIEESIGAKSGEKSDSA
ncbi:MAG: cache domain-containing protein, partial [Treponemataceae bacterium]|nr:cache domain-containing protein [Treponemataceae bacterium]